MSYGMIDGWGYTGWGGMAFGGMMMLFWFVLQVGLIVIVVRWLGGAHRCNASQDALDTLKQRFARGEIDTSEFEERSRQLRASE